MEASMKKWFIIPAVLVLLLAGSATALLLSLNSLIVREVNTVGPELTGTAVRLEKADVSLFSGTGVFSGFTVGNPKGFADAPALSVGSVSMELVPSSVLNEAVVIPKIEIIRPDVLYELAEDTSNIEAILKHVRHVAEKNKTGSGEAAQAEPSAEAKKKLEKKVIIDELIIREAKATIRIPVLKLSVSLPLPEIRITGIGREGSGVTLAQGAVIVLKEVKAALESAAVSFREKQFKEAKDTLLREGRTTEEKAKALWKEGLNLFKK